MLNFLILTYKERGGTEKHQEVLFGGGRYASESGEAVFKSKDPRVVQEFRDLYQVLCNSSDRVPANALRDRFHRGAIVHETWEQSKLYELLNQIEPRSVDQIESGESDLRISTSFFIDYFGLRQKALLGLSKKGVRIEILLMNPENQELMAGRFALRKDGLQTERAKRDLVSDLRSLAEFTNIEVRLSDSMPCGYVVHSRDWVVFGLMPAHDSYVSSPMIEAAAGTTLWQMLSEDWKVRWDAAKPYEMHKSVGA